MNFNPEIQADLNALRLYLKLSKGNSSRNFKDIFKKQYTTSKNKNMTAESIKKIRLKIDKCIKSCDLIEQSRYLAFARTEFERSKMRLGKILEAMNEINPYPQSKNPESNVIAKQTDSSCETFAELFANIDNVAKIKYMRKVGTDIVLEMSELFITDLGETSIEISHKEAIYRDMSIVALEEGVMWLGAELNRIFESKK